MTGGEFFEQFIEDYFAECDEHLATVRRVLLGLEGHSPRSAPDPAMMREMLRALHTLKGLSGMVGDACAERLAHQLEDVLRSVEQGSALLEPRLVDSLFAGAETLERCIAARRTGVPSPDIDQVVTDLARAAALPPPPAARVEAVPDEDDEARAGDLVYHFEFVPSIALTERGIGVDSVRTRLRSLGVLLDAKPRIIAGGVAFDFWVAVPPSRAPDESWTGDGLRWTAADVADHADTATAAEPAEPPEPAGPAGPAATAPAPATSSNVVRVDLARLDGVMRLVGELVVSRSRLDELLRLATPENADATKDALDETNAAMERQLRRLRESVMRIRLVPVGEVFERLRFAARDAIRESGKQVALVFHGQSTEIDKLVVDRMLEPLLHLVRNAVSHGIESPAERLARGKPAQGTLTLRAAASGDRILVHVEDDGAGIDVERVASRARARGILGPTESLAGDRLLDVLCAPGFSTRDEADRTSGRGVGMEVVRSAVRALAGSLTVETTPGAGTRFAIELPLTLMILDALLVEISGQQMAVPQPALREILQVDSAAIVAFENNDVVAYRGGVLPLVSLARLFGLPEGARSAFFVLVVGSDAAPMGLIVDRLHGLREIVVYPVADPLVALPGIAGATELGDGRVSLILDAAALLRLAQEQRERRAERSRLSAIGHRRLQLPSAEHRAPSAESREPRAESR